MEPAVGRHQLLKLSHKWSKVACDLDEEEIVDRGLLESGHWMATKGRFTARQESGSSTLGPLLLDKRLGKNVGRWQLCPSQ
ncbi:hypothetical protein BDW62DRAFT_64098 [Aspergillus aurantiobrunneus]